MNFKTTYLLLGSLVVIFAVFAVVLFYDPGAKDTGNYVLPQFHATADSPKPEDVDRVEIRRNEPKQPAIVLEREPSTKQWRIVEPVAGRANKSAVETLVRELSEAARANNEKAPSLAAWGLDPPQAVVTLKIGADQTITLNVGKEGGVGDSQFVYLQDPSRPKDPMPVRRQTVSSLFKQFPDYRSPVLLVANADDVQGVKLKEGNKEVELEKKDGRWLYTNPADYGPAEYAGTIVPSDSTRAPGSMNLLLANLTNLKVGNPAADFVADNVSDADLAKYNLDDKSDVLRVRVKIAGKEKPVQLIVGVGKKVDDKYYYAKLADEKAVVRVAATDPDALRNLVNEPGSLRSHTLVLTEQPVDAIDVSNSFGITRLRRHAGAMPTDFPSDPRRRLEPDSWRIWRDDNSSVPVDPDAITAPQSLPNLLKQKDLIASFIEVKGNLAELEKTYELTKPTAFVWLWAGDDGIVKDEPKDEKKDEKKDPNAKDDKLKSPPKLKTPDEPSYKISFGKQLNEGGRDFVVVKREAKQKVGDKTTYEVTLAKIPLLVYEKAKLGPLSYMEKQLPPYNPTLASENVTKVVFQRPTATLELTRANDKDPWKIVKPDAFAGRMADPGTVDHLLESVNRMVAQQLVVLNPNDADLDKLYGLTNAPSKVEITVTKDGKPTTYTASFGKDGPKDGPTETYYGRLSWNDKVVFSVPKFFVEGLPSDYQDTTVAKFDVANVKTVKMTGWQNLVGAPVALDLERKDATSWTVKAPAEFNLDAAKLNAFLIALSNLKADKFVAKLPKLDAELDVAKGALKIEITFEKDDKPLEIVAGKLDGELYFATSNRVPGEVFTIKKAVFEGAKSKPAFFNP